MIETFLARFKQYIWHTQRSLKTVILLMFIPTIIIFVLLIGLISYSLAAGQIQANNYLNIRDTVVQTRNYLDNRLTAIFEQLVALENDAHTLSMLKQLSRESVLHPDDYIQVDWNLERIFGLNYSILDSILVYFNEGRLVMSKKEYMISRILFDYSYWRAAFNGNRTEYYWRNIHRNDIFLTPDPTNKIVSVFKLFGNDESRIRGIILFNLKEEFFKDILQNAQISENGSLVLISPNGMINFKEMPWRYRIDKKVERDLLLNREEPSGRFTIRNHNGKKIIIIYDTIPINQWKIAAVFPEDDILNRAVFIKNITLAVTVFLILAAMVLSNLLAKTITTPLFMLTDKVKQVKAGNLEVPFDINVPNEIGVLNEGLSELLGRVKQLLEQIRSEQEQKRLAELDVLQAQIKPHFLYNTLDSINQLCEMGENREARAMVTALAKFFRISISGGQEIIDISEEIEHIRNYLVILKMRYADKFEYQILVEPELLSYKIIKLTLQPLVENAIYHGIKEKRGKGLVTVSGYRDGSDVIVEVRDNGAGMSMKTLKQIREWLSGTIKGRGFGLCNIHRRLQLHFGPKYGLAIESKQGEGTLVRVMLPVKK